MAWQRPNYIVRTVRSVPLTSQLEQSFSQRRFPPSISPRLPTTSIAQKRHQNSLSTPPGIHDFKAAPPIEFDKSDNIPARILPASPAYFTGTPKFTDHFLNLERVRSKYAFLPTIPGGEAPRMAWLRLPDFRTRVGEMVPTAKYRRLLNILKRLNRIHPSLMPEEVKETMEFFLRPGNPYQKQSLPAEPDDMGRARGVGRRKT